MKELNEEIILHISDTPENIFLALNTVIKKLNPQYIVHTGDLVDNIKLEFSKNAIDRYNQALMKLINILENSNAKQIYLCVGNHDNEESISKFKKRSIVVKESKIISIGDLKLNISHFPENITKNTSEYNLFGHNLSLENGVIDEKVYLNGISSINIITVKTGQVFKLLYPFGTDDMRLVRRRVRL